MLTMCLSFSFVFLKAVMHNIHNKEFCILCYKNLRNQKILLT